MTTLKHLTIHLVFALLLVGIVTGCSKTPRWLTGKYEIDLETTTKEIEQAKKDAKAEKRGETVSGAAQELAMAFAPFALKKVYGGATVTITSNEITTTKDGNGTVVSFEIHETPSKDSVSIKTSKGTVETWIRTETGIAKTAEGDAPILIHFKRQLQ